MSNLHTKVIGFLLILFCYKTGHCQLTLENIFLTNKYVAAQAEDVEFLHKKPGFAELINTGTTESVVFYNLKHEKTDEWKISENAANKKTSWNNLILSNTDVHFLVSCNNEQIYRRSFLCNYFIGDRKGVLTPLSDGKQFYPSFSPDDTKIGFIKNNNLFYKDLTAAKEMQITNDGEWNKMINGKSDWVYEEEFEMTRAYEWNPQSDKIAYLKFDERNVKEYSIPLYYDMQYPNLFTYKYPKAGEENSKVSVSLYDIKSKKNKPLSLPYSYEYIPRIWWNASGNEVIAMLLNRHQDSLQLVSCNIKTGETKQLYLETNNTYVEVPKTVHFLSDNSFLLSSEKDGFNHLYHYDKDGKLLKQLTKGNYETTEIYGVDESKKQVYFQSNEGNEIETAIFRLNYETLQKEKLSQRNGSNKAAFSKDFSCFIHTYSNASTPPQITLERTDTTSSILMEDNRFLQDSLATIPTKEFIKIPVHDYQLNAWILKSKNIDTTKKHPLFMYLYGGPGSQEVLNEWGKRSDLFFNYLAEQGYVVACVDNRGTGGRGSEFKRCTFLNLGKLETEDQMLAAGYLGNLSYIDKTNIGIYGWSYGGFMAANCLFTGNEIFKAAISAAPVSNWSLYSTVYTERYMRTPKENPGGYHSFNPNILAKRLKGDFLLIHGTADDNVHFQHSIQLINALNDANKTYQLYIYPDSGHGTTGKKMRFDVYDKILQFLKQNLK